MSSATGALRHWFYLEDMITGENRDVVTDAGGTEQDARNLLGEFPDPALVSNFSNDRAVTRETPPTFLVHSADDNGVPIQNSLYYALALKTSGVPFAMQVYSHGGHGYGMGREDPILTAWPRECAAWLRKIGFFGGRAA